MREHREAAVHARSSPLPCSSLSEPTAAALCGGSDKPDADGSAVSLNSIPASVLEDILGHLDWRSLCSVAMTCKALAQVSVLVCACVRAPVLSCMLCPVRFS